MQRSARVPRTSTLDCCSRYCASGSMERHGQIPMAWMIRQLFLLSAMSTICVGGSTGYSLSLPEDEVCAGSVVAVDFVAPRNHSTQNAVVIYRGTAQMLRFLDEEKVPAGQRGTLFFETSRTLSEQQLWFQYVVNLAAASTPLASAGPLTLGLPGDECGVCGGDGSSCQGCDGVANSGLVYDRCGVCGGDDECVDCAGEPFGGREWDQCGHCMVPERVCHGGRLGGRGCDSDMDCELWPCRFGGEWDNCVDCNGVPDGGAEVDSCGTCGGSDSTCDREYAVRGPVEQMCASDALEVTWSGPANLPSTVYVGLAEVKDDGLTGAVGGWAYVIAETAGGVGGAFFRSGASGEVMGRSVHAVEGGGAAGHVTLNRSSVAEDAGGCGPLPEPQRCLQPLEYLRPQGAGRYRVLMFLEPASPLRVAQSSEFEVLPLPDECGVCGGDGQSCRGCDGELYSGREWDLCGVCGGGNECVGCDGVPDSGATEDVCGVCGGDEGSCTGCDGVARPGGPLREDACGNCGGSDDSCAKPPRVGLLPFPVTYTCVGRPTRFYWEAPSNRSSADHIVLCAASLPPFYIPIGCTPVLQDFVGAAGEALLDAGAELGAPAELELRYLERQRPDPSQALAVDFVVASRSKVTVLRASDPSCELLGYAVSPSASRYCMGERVRLRWEVSQKSEDSDLATAVLGVVQGDEPGAPSCYAPCSDAAEGCTFCYHRLCPAGSGCAQAGEVTLRSAGGGSGGLLSPTAPGSYRACMYQSVQARERAEPIICSSLFYVAAGEADECGVCGGDGTSCVGCDGVANSGKEVDECGVCGGNGKSCLGCDGVVNSGKEVDECGVCGGNGRSCAGCDGVPNSGTKFDSCGICGGGDWHCNDGYTLAIEGNCRSSRVTLSWTAPSNHPPLRIRVNSTGFPCQLRWGDIGAFTSNFRLAGQRLEAAGYRGCGEACTAGAAEFIADPSRLEMCATQGGEWTVWLDDPVSGKAFRRMKLRELAECGWCDRWYGEFCPFTEAPTTTTGEVETTTSSTTEPAAVATTAPPSEPETTPAGTDAQDPATTVATTTPAPVENATAVRGHLVLDVPPQTLLNMVTQVHQALVFAGSLKGEAMEEEDVRVLAVCRADGALCEWLQGRDAAKATRWTDDDFREGGLVVFEMDLLAAEAAAVREKIKGGEFGMVVAQRLFAYVGRQLEVGVPYFGAEREEGGDGGLSLLAGVVGGVLGVVCVGGGGWVALEITKSKRGGAGGVSGPFQRMGEEDLEANAIELAVQANAAQRAEAEERAGQEQEWVEIELQAAGDKSPGKSPKKTLSLDDIDPDDIEELDGKKSVEPAGKELSEEEEAAEEERAPGKGIGKAGACAEENGVSNATLERDAAGKSMGAKTRERAGSDGEEIANGAEAGADDTREDGGRAVQGERGEATVATAKEAAEAQPEGKEEGKGAEATAASAEKGAAKSAEASAVSEEEGAEAQGAVRGGEGEGGREGEGEAASQRRGEQEAPQEEEGGRRRASEEGGGGIEPAGKGEDRGEEEEGGRQKVAAEAEREKRAPGKADDKGERAGAGAGEGRRANGEEGASPRNRSIGGKEGGWVAIRTTMRNASVDLTSPKKSEDGERAERHVTDEEVREAEERGEVVVEGEGVQGGEEVRGGRKGSQGSESGGEGGEGRTQRRRDGGAEATEEGEESGGKTPTREQERESEEEGGQGGARSSTGTGSPGSPPEGAVDGEEEGAREEKSSKRKEEGGRGRGTAGKGPLRRDAVRGKGKGRGGAGRAAHRVGLNGNGVQ